MPNKPTIDHAARLVVAAWMNPGPHPDEHASMQDRLRKEWPTLAQAIEQLVEAIRVQPPPASPAPPLEDNEDD